MKKRADGRYVKKMTFTRNGVTSNKWFYAKSEKDLWRQVAEYRESFEKGRTFKEVAEGWREEHYKTIEYSTQRGYEPAYKAAIAEFGGARINAITPIAIKQYIDGLAKKGYAYKTISTHLLIMRLIMRQAAVDGEITVSPVSVVTLPKNLPRNPRELPDDGDVEKIKTSADSVFGLYMYLLLYTGLRKSEALALKYSDIDKVEKIIYIRRAFYFKNRKPHVKVPKTRAGIRTVPLLDVLAEKLPNKSGDEYIFSHDGEPYSFKRYEREFDKYRRDTGIKCTAHQLRHAYATILFEAGISEKDAQELLGHSDIYTTKNIYTHISKTRKKEVADILNKHVK